MDYPEAMVISVEPESATVEVDAAAVCERCATGRGCGAALPGKRRKRRLKVPVSADMSLRVGDTVRLALEPARLARAAWLAYGLPLVAMVVAVSVGSQSVASDAGVAACGIGGLLAGVLTGRHILRKTGALREFVPIAVARSKTAVH